MEGLIFFLGGVKKGGGRWFNPFWEKKGFFLWGQFFFFPQKGFGQ